MITRSPSDQGEIDGQDWIGGRQSGNPEWHIKILAIGDWGGSVITSGPLDMYRSMADNAVEVY